MAHGGNASRSSSRICASARRAAFYASHPAVMGIKHQASGARGMDAVKKTEDGAACGCVERDDSKYVA